MKFQLSTTKWTSATAKSRNVTLTIESDFGPFDILRVDLRSGSRVTKKLRYEIDGYDNSSERRNVAENIAKHFRLPRNTERVTAIASRLKSFELNSWTK